MQDFVDHWFDHLPLLKGLLKDKGERQQIEMLQLLCRRVAAEQELVLYEMRQLAHNYEAAYKPPRVMSLKLRNVNGHTRVSWRLPKRGAQTYIRPFQTQQGWEVIKRLPLSMIRELQQFETSRMVVNWHATLLTQILTTTQQLLDGIDASAGMTRRQP